MNKLFVEAHLIYERAFGLTEKFINKINKN